MTIMEHIRRYGPIWVIVIAVFFGLSILGGLGIANFGSSVQHVAPQLEQAQQERIKSEVEKYPIFAEIEGRQIKTADFMRAYELTRDNQMQTTGAPIDPEGEGKLMQQVLDNFLQAEFLIKYALDRGEQVTEKEVSDNIEQLVQGYLSINPNPPTALAAVREKIKAWRGRSEALKQILAREQMSLPRYREEVRKILLTQRGMKLYREEALKKLKQEALDRAREVKEKIEKGDMSWAEAVAGYHEDYRAKENEGEMKEPIGRDTFPESEETDSVYKDILLPKPKEGSIVGPFYLGNGVYVFKIEKWIEIDPEEAKEKLDELAPKIREANGWEEDREVTVDDVIAFERKAKVKAIKFRTQFELALSQKLKEDIQSSKIVIYYPFLNAWRAVKGYDDLSPDAVAQGRKFTDEEKTRTDIDISGGTINIKKVTPPRYDEAVGFLNQALNADPERPTYLFYLAQLYQQWWEEWQEWEQFKSEQESSGEESDEETLKRKKPWDGPPPFGSEDELKAKVKELLEQARQASFDRYEYNPYLYLELARIYQQEGKTEELPDLLTDILTYAGRDKQLLEDAKSIAEAAGLEDQKKEFETALADIAALEGGLTEVEGEGGVPAEENEAGESQPAEGLAGGGEESGESSPAPAEPTGGSVEGQGEG